MWNRKQGRNKQVTRIRPDIEALEARVLYSADVIPLAEHQPVSEVAVVERVENASTDSKHDIQQDNDDTVTIYLKDLENALTASDQNHTAEIAELIFVDHQIEDVSTLLDEIGKQDTSTQVVLLDSSQNVLQQISSELSKYQNIAAVHFITHGDDASIHFGKQWITAENLYEFKTEFSNWKPYLNEQADLLFYGCNIAESNRGKAMLDLIGLWTGADVAASNNLTGHSDLNADWTLEYKQGEIETDTRFSSQLQTAWHSTLAYPAPNTVSNNFEWITNVSIGSINNTSSKDASAYGDYTALSTSIEAGASVGISVTIHDDSDDHITAWVDWNQDEDFDDAGEEFIIASGVSTNGPFSTTIVAPNDAALGTTRMRVALVFDAVPITSSIHNYGEIEDYSIVVPNSAPVITHAGGSPAASLSIPENTTAITTITATDVNSHTIYYSFTGGADSSLFIINSSTGALSFASAHDFENPLDANSDGIYEVEVSATDSLGASNNQHLYISVSNQNEIPAAADNTITINEDVSYAFAAADFNFTDVDTGDSLSSVKITALESVGALQLNGADVAINQIISRADIDAGNLTYTPLLNESGSNYDSFQFSVSDGALESISSYTLTLDVTAINDSPTIASNTGTTVAEASTANNITSAMLNAADVDDSSTGLTYTVTTDVSNGMLKLAGIAIGLNDTFTQDDIDNNRLTYDHDGSQTNSDGFDFSLADGGENGAVAVPGTFNFTVTNVNDAPVITSNGGAPTANVNANENQTAVTTVTSTDDDLDPLSYSITGGADSALLSIDANTGALTFNSAPNFENPTDANNDGIYLVVVNVSDGNSGSDVQAISVSVNDINDAPAITSNGGAPTANVNANENQTAVTTVTSIDADLDPLSYSISGGADSALFSIDTNTGVLTFNSAPNFENSTDANNDGVYIVEVTVSDGNSGSDVQVISVTVNDINDAPAITANGGAPTANVNANENQTAVTTVTSTDDDLDPLSYSITGGADSALFNIDANTGALTFNSAPNFENPTDANNDGVYIVEVTVSDGNSGSDVQAISVTVNDINDAPAITSNGGAPTAYVNANENQTAVTTVTSIDADLDPLSYSISGGADSALFSIDTNTGVLTFNSAPNFENSTDANNDGVYIVEVTVSDGNSGSDVQVISVTVNDINDAPAITANGGAPTANVNANENQTAVTTVTSTDDDLDPLSYSISGGADSALLSIDANTGALTFNSAPNFENPTDANNDGVYIVEVTVSDGNSGSDVQAISVTVNDINEAPTAANNRITIDEDNTFTFAAADFGFSDVDSGDTLGSIKITTLESYGALQLNSVDITLNQVISRTDIDSGKLKFVPVSDANGPSYDSFGFSVNDGALDSASSYTMTIDVTVVNDSPTLATNTGITVAEASTGNTLTTAMLNEGDVDDSGTSLTYTITTDVTNGTLKLNGIAIGLSDTFTQDDIDNNRLTYDHDGSQTSSDSFDFSLADGGEDGATAAIGTFTFTVTNVNDAPVITSDGGGTTASLNAAENLTTVAIVTSTDADSDTVTYSNTGGADSALFNIDPNSGALTFTSAPNFETPGDANTDGIYVVEVTASDGNGGTDVQTLSVTITDVNEAPTAANSTVTTNEDVTYTFTAADFGFSDVDSGDTLDSVKITTLESVGTLELNGFDVTLNQVISKTDIDAGKLKFVPVSDGNGASYDSFRFSVNDGALDSVSSYTMTIDVTAVNDGPTVATNTGTTVAEASTGNTLSTAMLNEGDVDDAGTGLIYTITTDVTNGTLKLNGIAIGLSSTFTQDDIDNKRLTYDHDGSQSNSDNFDFSLADGGENGVAAVPGTFNFTVTNVNDAPVITSNGGAATAAITTAENQTSVTTVTSNDADQDTISYSISGGGDSGLFSIDANSGALTFNNAADYENPTDTNTDGDYVVEVTAADVHGGIDVQTITITITAVNDNHPVIISNGSGTTAEITLAENQTAVTQVDATDADLPAETLSYAISGGADAGLFSINSITGVLSFKTAPDREMATDADDNHRYDVIVTANDGTLTDSQAITVTVTDTDEFNISTLIDSDISLNQVNENAINGSSVGITAFANDADATNNTISYTLTDNAQGRFTIDANSGLVTVANQNLLDFETGNSHPVTVRATSADGSVSETTFNITIANVDEQPIATNDSYSGTEDTTLITGNVLNNDDLGDTPGAISAFDSISDQGGTVHYNNDGSFTYTPKPDFNGVDSFTYTVMDNSGDLSTGTVTLIIAAQNDAPIAQSDTLQVDEDNTLLFTTDILLANDSDAEQNPLSLIIDSGPQHGVFNVLPNGAFSYTPDTHFNGNDGFTYHLSDGVTISQTVNVEIQIAAVNDAPEISDSSIRFDEDGFYQFSSKDFNYSDVDQDPLQQLQLESLPAQGRLLLNGKPLIAGARVHMEALLAGHLSFSSKANDYGEDFANFSVRVFDGELLSQTSATITVHINATDDAPFINSPMDILTNFPGQAVQILNNSGEPLTLEDFDSNTGKQRLEFNVAEGQLSIAEIPDAIEVSGMHSSLLTLEGTTDALNQTLAQLSFLPRIGFSGEIALIITAHDLMDPATGQLGFSTTTVVELNITAVRNDEEQRSSEVTPLSTATEIPQQDAVPEVTNTPETSKVNIQKTLHRPPLKSRDNEQYEKHSAVLHGDAVYRQWTNLQAAERQENIIVPEISIELKKGGITFESKLDYTRARLVNQLLSLSHTEQLYMNQEPVIIPEIRFFGEWSQATDQADVELTSLKFAASGLSLTTFLWVLRHSGFMASLLLSYPAWRNIDMLPVLTSQERK